MPTPDPLDTLESRYPIAGLADLLDPMWQKGWQPLDIARFLGADNALSLAIYADALTVNRQRWHCQAAALWSTQAEDLGASATWWNEHLDYWRQFMERRGTSAFAVESAARFFSMMADSCVTLPLLEAPPTEAGWRHRRSSPDTTVLAKVRALLAKAESTTFAEEAEALSAKAQQLIARHAIDVALLADEVDVPGGKRIYIDPPYAKAKFVLLDNIARANGCRCCWNEDRATATLIGHQSELHLAEVLFTSLLLQATAVVVSAKPAPDPWGRSTTRSWRNSFWYGYAYRIGQRLDMASDAARTQHQTETGRDLLPVLASRADAVEQAFEETFPHLASLSTSISNADGLTAGHAFGDRADLVGTNTVPGRATPQLSR